MLTLSASTKIFFYRGPIDLRKGFEGLSALVEANPLDALTSGSYFVFLNRTRDRMKVLYWDLDGLAIWYKRLEKGCFSNRDIAEGHIDRRDFLMLLEGVTPQRLQERHRPF